MYDKQLTNRASSQIDKTVLTDVIRASDLLKQERTKVTSTNLALLLVHDLLLSKGIQAGDGPIKQAILRHKTRLQAELTKIKIKRGVKSVSDLAQAADPRTGTTESIRIQDELLINYLPVNRTNPALRAGEYSSMDYQRCTQSLPREWLHTVRRSSPF